MSVTIDSLDIQIRSSAGSAAKNIDELADKLSKLNSNAKVTKIVNSLSNLNKALSDMKSQQAVMSHLSALSKSLSSLAAIPKLTGLQSAIRELKKLPEVMQSLDTAEISQFTSKMKLLASGLSPLATQIDKISKGFSKLPPHVSKCVTAVKRLDSANRSVTKSTQAHGDALKSQSFSILAAYENLENVFGMMHGIQDAAAKVLNDAIQWDSVQARFGRAMGDSAEEYLVYAQRVNEEMGINQQQFMGYSSLFADMMRGFGVGQGDAATMAVGFTELAYDIWAGTGDVFKTLEEAMDAVRSTIGGETESIQRAGFSVIESTLKETAARHGLAVNIEKATMAEKTYLRYLTLVDQAHARSYVGVYAAEMKTAEGAMRSLSQSVKTLSQAFGSLFIPVLELVIPYITAFVEAVTDGVRYIAGLFGIELFEIDWRSTSSGLDGVADGATDAATGLGAAADEAKKLKQYTMGFDELNVINPNSGSGSGAAGAAGGNGNWFEGVDLDTLWDESVFEAASKRVDELKQKIKDFFDEWRAQIELFGAGTMLMTLGKIVDKLKEAEIFSGGFFKNMNTISKIGLSTVIVTIQWMLMDEALGNFIEEGSWGEYIKAAVEAAIGTWVLYKMWGSSGVVIGLGVTAAVSFKATFEDGNVDSIEEITTGLTGLAAGVGAAAVLLKKTDLGTAIKMVLGGAKIGEVLAAMFPNAANVLSTASTWITKTLLPGIGGALSKVLPTAITKLPGTIAGIVTKIPGWGWIVGALIGAIGLAVVDADFTDIGHKIGSGIGTVLRNIGDFLGGVGGWLRDMWDKIPWDEPISVTMARVGGWIVDGLIGGIWDGFVNLLQNIGEFFSGLVDGVKDALGIHSPSTVFAEIGTNIIAGLLNGITEKWDALKEWVNKNVMPKFTLEYWKGKFDVIRQAISNKLGEVKQAAINKWTEIKTWFSNNIAPKFTLTFWLDKFKSLKEGFTQTIKNAVNAGIDLMNRFIGWLNEKLHFSWDALTLLGKEVFPAGSIQLFTIPPIPRLADGGFVGAGQMFIAREAGPELVGNINGRTAVANNDQIVAAVSQGVYSAVVAAMSASSGSGGQSINVYLDGRQITAAVEKRQSERGRSIMGNQLGYAY